MDNTGWVAMMVRAARSSVLRSCVGLRATVSRCWIP